MIRSLVFAITVALSATVEAQHWPSFRGRSASGISDDAGGPPPVRWDVTRSENVAWKVPIRGLGHSSPIVWGDRIFVTTAVSSTGMRVFRPEPLSRDGEVTNVDSAGDEPSQLWMLVALDRRTGKVLWEQTAHQGVPKVKRHVKNSHASSTPATDGQRVVAWFGSEGLYTYTLDGRLLWKADLGLQDVGWSYDPDYQWGVASSPVIHRDLVIVQCDRQTDSFIVALDVETGKERWRTPRDEIPSWGTPTVVEAEGRAVVVTNATQAVRGYDLETGKELWKIEGNSELSVPTPVVAHNLVFVSSGYRPVQPIFAIRPNATGDITPTEESPSNRYVAWSTRRGGPYIPSPIVVGDLLYVCANNGVLTAYRAPRIAP
jgi:outer membrane protein assembly factor BamB